MILHQAKYSSEVWKKFNILECNTAIRAADTNLKLVNLDEEKEDMIDATTLKNLVVSLICLCQSRPNISHSIELVSRFMSNPLKQYFISAKSIMRYISGTLQYRLLFPLGKEHKELELVGFSNVVLCDKKIDRRSTTSYLFIFLWAPISWCSKKKSLITSSSCEAEYVVGVAAACQVNWLQYLLNNLRIKFEKPIKLLIDNKSAIHLARNSIARGNRKHIRTRFYFLRDQITKSKLEVM